MILVIMLASSIIISLLTAFFLIKALYHMLKLTVSQIIVKELRASWLLYVQLALGVAGLAFGVNSSNIRQIIAQRDMQNISIEVFFVQMWSTFIDTALAIVISVLILFFIYLVVYYLNGLHQPSDKDAP